MCECSKQETFNEIRKDIDNLYIIKDVVIELKTLVAIQIEQVEKQGEHLKDQSETLIEITNTVKHQGEFVKKLNEKFDDLRCKFNQQTIDDLMDKTISFNQILRIILEKALAPILLAALAYFIMQS